MAVKIKYCSINRGFWKWFTRKYKYELVEDYVVQTGIRPAHDIETRYLKLSANGLLFIRKGYRWDGASGPTLDTPSTMRGALIHDALYQLMRMDLLDYSFKPMADELLRTICIDDGMISWRARYYWLAVRSPFGRWAIKPSPLKRFLNFFKRGKK